MKRIRTYIILSAVLAFAVISCSKGSTGDTPISKPDPDKPSVEPSLPNISFGKATTKALIDNDDLLTNGNRIKVYDLLSSFSGTITGWDGSSPYIVDEVVYNGNTVWSYVSSGIYPWTSSGTHHFFGYLSHIDAAAGGENMDVGNLFTPGLTTTMAPPTASLRVPTSGDLTFTSASTQFDFIYSNMETRAASAKDYSVVPLSFKHLFTALSVQVKNLSETPVRIHSITFQGLKNKNNATITFGDPSSVAYGSTPTISGSFFPSMSSYVELVQDHSYDALAQVLSTGTTSLPKVYKLLWPLSADDVAPTNDETDLGRINDGCQNLATDSIIVVTYRRYVDGAWAPALADPPKTARIKLPHIDWEAGKKYHFNIEFTDKIIQLTGVVMPWDYKEWDIDYSEGSVVVPKQLKYTEGTYQSIDGTNKRVIVANGTNPKATFTIMAPVGGVWTVNKSGDLDFFTVTPTSGSINPNVNGGEVEITVSPHFTMPRTTEKKIRLTFYVTKGEREVNANEEINRDNYWIVLPAN